MPQGNFFVLTHKFNHHCFLDFIMRFANDKMVTTLMYGLHDIFPGVDQTTAFRLMSLGPPQATPPSISLAENGTFSTMSRIYQSIYVACRRLYKNNTKLHDHIMTASEEYKRKFDETHNVKVKFKKYQKSINDVFALFHKCSDIGTETIAHKYTQKSILDFTLFNPLRRHVRDCKEGGLVIVGGGEEMYRQFQDLDSCDLLLLRVGKNEAEPPNMKFNTHITRHIASLNADVEMNFSNVLLSPHVANDTPINDLIDLIATLRTHFGNATLHLPLIHPEFINCTSKFLHVFNNSVQKSKEKEEHCGDDVITVQYSTNFDDLEASGILHYRWKSKDTIQKRIIDALQNVITVEFTGEDKDLPPEYESVYNKKLFMVIYGKI